MDYEENNEFDRAVDASELLPEAFGLDNIDDDNDGLSADGASDDELNGGDDPLAEFERQATSTAHDDFRVLVGQAADRGTRPHHQQQHQQQQQQTRDQAVDALLKDQRQPSFKQYLPPREADRKVDSTRQVSFPRQLDLNQAGLNRALQGIFAKVPRWAGRMPSLPLCVCVRRCVCGAAQGVISVLASQDSEFVNAKATVTVVDGPVWLLHRSPPRPPPTHTHTGLCLCVGGVFRRVVILGISERNRAYHNDLVTIELIAVELPQNALDAIYKKVKGGRPGATDRTDHTDHTHRGVLVLNKCLVVLPCVVLCCLVLPCVGGSARGNMSIREREFALSYHILNESILYGRVAR